MRRSFACAIVALALGLAAVLVSASPALAAAQPETITISITDVKTVALAHRVDHVAVYWFGNPEAHVTLAFSADGTTFGPPFAAGLDDTGPERNNGTTYGAMQAVKGTVAVRVATDVPIAQLTVVAIPPEEGVTFRLETEPAPAPIEYEDDEPLVISRAEWGADPVYLTWAPRFYPPTKVIVHHTSDNIRMDESAEYYAKLIRAIYYYHAVTQDWDDIAYNFLIDPLGNIYEGRYSDDDPLSPFGEDVFGNAVVGGHCANYNTGTLGIAVLGTYVKQDITPAARASLEQLVAWLVKRHGIDPLGIDPYYNPYNSGSTIQVSNIAGHLDYRSTDCPGLAFYKTLPSLRQTVFDRTGPVSTPVPSPTYLILDKSQSAPSVGQQVTFTATLRQDGSNTPLPGQPVAFAISGVAFPATPLGTAVTDANGVATLQVACTIAAMQWVSATFTPATPAQSDEQGSAPIAQYRGSTTSTELDIAPTGMTALLSGSSVQLSWTPEPAATSYNIYRDGTRINKSVVSSPSYVDANLSAPTKHYYQVTAIVSGRESAKSAKATATTYTPGDEPDDGDPAETPLFPDVLAGNPYYTAVRELALTGIINGAPGGLFLPADPVTRQQFSKMIVLGGEYDVSEDDLCPFKDVEPGGGATLYPDNYVAVCAAHGITLGKTATLFAPFASITRAQVLTMVVRAAQDLKPDAVPAPPLGWKGKLSTKDPAHGKNIARAEYNGLLAGIDLSAFSVNAKATRGEIAQIIWNLRAK